MNSGAVKIVFIMLVAAGWSYALWRLVYRRRAQRLHWRDVLATSRPGVWAYTAVPFLIGGWLGFGHLEWPLVVGFLYFLVPYNLALYGIPDMYDAIKGIKNQRLKAAESQLIPPSQHAQLWQWIVLTSVPFIAYLALNGSPISNIWLALALFLVVAYSLQRLRFKEVPFLDSLTSSAHFWTPLVYGTLLGGASVSYRPALAAFILWGIASHAFSSIQDLPYDKAAGIGSIAVSMGERGAMYFSLICYVLAAILPVLGLGWDGVIPGLLLSSYVINLLVVGFGSQAASIRYRRGWKVFQRLNIVVGLVLVVVLFIAINPFGRELLLH